MTAETTGPVRQHYALATGKGLTEVPVQKDNPGYQGKNKVVQKKITRPVGRGR